MFKDLTKIQINSEGNVTLAIKIAENHVHNLILKIETFALILSKDTDSWNGLIHHKYWTLQKLSDRVKLFDENYEYHYRFSLQQWDDIRKQFKDALRLHNGYLK